MTIGLVEDKAHLREWVSGILRRSSEVKEIQLYTNAESALEEIPSTCLDVVLMDIDLPGMSGIECVHRLKSRCPRTQIIMLTIFDNEERIFEALQAGASGYLLKKTPPDELLKYISDVMKGIPAMSMIVAQKVMEIFRRIPVLPVATGSMEELSSREQEILAYLSKGYMYKEIAEKFDISVHTVRSHLRNIYEKLHVKTRTEATAKYLQHLQSPIAV
jgi:DNA-binding NarL/FixJ family response regulator